MDSTKPVKWDRKVPFPSSIVIQGMNMIYTVAYTILNPLELAPASMAFISGGLFGLLLLPIGAIYGLLYLLPKEGPWHDVLLYLLYLFLGWYLVTVVVDDSHCRVEDACFRIPQNYFDNISYEYFKAIFDYFPMTCLPANDKVKLDPNKQYIFGVHPHGIHCFPLAFLASPDTPFDRLFPGFVYGSKVTPKHPLTGLAATIMFKIPVVREFFLTFGYIDASRPVAEAALKAGKSLFVCTGGEEESMYTNSNEDVLVLKHRKGFVRLALSHGADLCPIFGINNAETFRTYSVAMEFRMWVQKTFKIALPIFHGRWGTPLPYPVPLQVVVGEPIQVPKPIKPGENPDSKLVDQYHLMYIERVKELHAKFSDRPLKIV
jgi:Diacylglycerol acyltransferase